MIHQLKLSSSYFIVFMMNTETAESRFSSVTWCIEWLDGIFLHETMRLNQAVMARCLECWPAARAVSAPFPLWDAPSFSSLWSWGLSSHTPDGYCCGKRLKRGWQKSQSLLISFSRQNLQNISKTSLDEYIIKNLVITYCLDTQP